MFVSEKWTPFAWKVSPKKFPQIPGGASRALANFLLPFDYRLLWLLFSDHSPEKYALLSLTHGPWHHADHHTFGQSETCCLIQWRCQWPRATTAGGMIRTVVSWYRGRNSPRALLIECQDHICESSTLESTNFDSIHCLAYSSRIGSWMVQASTYPSTRSNLDLVLGFLCWVLTIAN